MREMKYSGIEWLGDIPQDWNIKKVKNIVRRKNEKNRPDEQVLSLYRDLGIVIKDDRNDNFNVTSENTENYKFVEANDLVVNKMKAWQGSIAVSSYQGIVSPAYYVYHFIDNKICPRYVHYVLRCKAYLPEYRRLSGGIRLGQWDLSDENFRNIPLPLPQSIAEQKRIADYLDCKCSQIDAIIYNQEAIVGKLENYRLSIITDAVTKGLNPNAELASSGISWISEFPRHWSSLALKNATDFITCGVASTPEYTEKENGVLFLSAQNVKFGYMDYSSENYITRELHNTLTRKRKPRKGDLLQVRVGATIGNVAIVDTEQDFSVYVSLTHMRSNEKVTNRYLMYCLLCPLFKQSAISHVDFAGSQGNLNVADLRALKIPIPPKEEQIAICNFLDKKLSKIDKYIETTQTIIKSFTDFKSSLIYEVVTGKKEI